MRLAIVAAFGLVGCGSPVVTTFARVRQPSLVAVEVQPMRGEHVDVERAPSGAVVAASARGARHTLVDDSGALMLAYPPGELGQVPRYRLDADGASFTRTLDEPGGRFGRTVGTVSLTTPRSNLVEIRVRREPSHASSVPWLALGAVFAAGSVAATYGVFTPDAKPAERVGYGLGATLFATLAAVVLGEGFYRVTGKASDIVAFP